MTCHAEPNPQVEEAKPSEAKPSALKLAEAKPSEAKPLGRLPCRPSSAACTSLTVRPVARRYNPNLFYICCDICESWFHGKCVGLTDWDGELVSEYVCAECEGATGHKTV